MITKLHISNYALIDQLDIDFNAGFTIITGETGAGKSIILGALALILGGRADSSSIRDKNKKTIVEAHFDISADNDLKSLLHNYDIEPDDDDIAIVRREISATGRSRVFINDCVTNVSTLRDVMSRLVDIHSQHSNTLLSQQSFQLAVIDNIGRNNMLLADYKKQYTSYRQSLKELQKFQEAYEKSAADLEYITFQHNQLSQLDLKENEEEELDTRQRRLSNAGEIREALWNIETLLNGDDNSVISNLSSTVSYLNRISDTLEEADNMTERINNAIIELKDIALTTSTISNTISDNPNELQAVEERQNTLYDAFRKYKVESSAQLILLRDELANRINNVQNFDTQKENLELRLNENKSKCEHLALELKMKRQKAASLFISKVKPLALSLGMKNLEFEVQITDTELGESGSDDIKFLFSFNKNQELMPVKDIASGGEISRLMLCIKSVIAESMNLPTLIFDEVDTGVSGEIAAKMGEMMHSIASRIQVISITHLPQVAAKGDNHLRVFKHDTSVETVTAIETLSRQQHINEIARMLSAGEIDEAAIANAHSLIGNKQKTLFEI